MSGQASEPYDPLRLCIYATVALLAWLLGPWAVAGFAALGLAGYIRARRGGLLRSKCALRDTPVWSSATWASSRPWRSQP